jgi:hypothetical protein
MDYLCVAFFYEMQGAFEQAASVRFDTVTLALGWAVIVMLLPLFVIYFWVTLQANAPGKERPISQGEQLARILALAGVLVFLLDLIDKLTS